MRGGGGVWGVHLLLCDTHYSIRKKYCGRAQSLGKKSRNFHHHVDMEQTGIPSWQNEPDKLMFYVIIAHIGFTG